MNENGRDAWLAALIVGSEVMLYQFGRPKCIAKVERLTPTQILVKTNERDAVVRFTKKRGDEFGGCGSYTGARIEPVTDKNRDAIEQRRILLRASDFAWSSCDLTELRALDVIMTSAKARWGK